MTGERYRIGELARAAGVTVRALHHYDSLGLLVPSERTGAGHRLYSAADVERLYRLLALRGVGIPLEEIGPLLDRQDGVADTVRRHLGRIDQQLGTLERLRLRLTRLLAALDGDGASTAQFLDAMEAMTMFEKYYTPEQLEQLEQRRQALGEEEIKKVEREWADLYARLRERAPRGRRRSRRPRAAGARPARRRADPDVHRRRPRHPGLAAADVRAGGPGEGLARHGLARGLRVHGRDPRRAR
jgi:DNA-binding transcriptional MerR regulator